MYCLNLVDLCCHGDYNTWLSLYRAIVVMLKKNVYCWFEMGTEQCVMFG